MRLASGLLREQDYDDRILCNIVVARYLDYHEFD